jgi:hypothetical protein
MSDEKQKVHVDSDIIIEEVQLGLWKLKLGHPPSLNLRRLLDSIKSAYPLYSRLFLDIYRISPRHFTFFLMCQAWKGVEAAILLHLSSSLLSQVRIIRYLSTPYGSSLMYSIGGARTIDRESGQDRDPVVDCIAN